MRAAASDPETEDYSGGAVDIETALSHVSTSHDVWASSEIRFEAGLRQILQSLVFPKLSSLLLTRVIRCRGAKLIRAALHTQQQQQAMT